MTRNAQDSEDLRSDLAYERLVRDITAAVAGGTLKPGDRLPSEVKLRRQYGISINSIRRGMDILARQGLVRRRRGSGTYVRETLPAVPRPAAPDTPVILLANVIEHLPAHPYFGERKRALLARLAERGWRTEIPEREAWPTEQHPVVWRHEELPRLLRRLEERRPAAVIADRFTVEPLVRAAQGRLPCVCLSPTPLCPFVEYDWDDELPRAIDIAMAPGVRRLWLVGARPDADPLVVRLRTACAARGVALHNTLIRPGIHSVLMHEACRATREKFASRRTVPDAVVMESHIHAQGVLDGLSERDPRSLAPLRLVAFVNRGHPLHTALPYTAVEADGAAAGLRLADLLHDLLTDPRRAPASIHLRCTVLLARNWPLIPTPQP